MRKIKPADNIFKDFYVRAFESKFPDKEIGSSLWARYWKQLRAKPIPAQVGINHGECLECLANLDCKEAWRLKGKCTLLPQKVMKKES
jgi:hypothetical protein